VSQFDSSMWVFFETRA